MRFGFLLILIALLLIHLIFSVLALFQANHFKSLSRSNPWITWGYMILTLIIDGTIVTVFWGIEF